MKKALYLLLSLLTCSFLLTACSGRSTLTGWYLEAENGRSLIITEEGEPLSISDRSRRQTLFNGLHSGDWIQIKHDAIAETYPGQTGVFSCKLLRPGSFEAVPPEAITALEEMGYTFDFHTHVPAEEPVTVDTPVSGYCGNTITEVTINGEFFSFWGSDSVTLTDILINLSYDPALLCRCLPEFTVDTEFGSGYGVNLSQAYARCDAGQASLTEEQVERIRNILQRNCT